MSGDTPKRRFSDREMVQRSIIDDAEGLVRRSVSRDIPLADLRLRGSDLDRAALISLARSEFARLSGITFLDDQETDLEPAQVRWVQDHIDAEYERTKTVNAPLFELRGVPAFPNKESILKSALKGLTKAQVEFMMETGRSPFIFQVKASGPSHRFDLLDNLLMGVSDKMHITSIVKNHMSNRANQGMDIQWMWDFYQSAQIIGIEAWDVIEDTIENRLARYKAEWTKVGLCGSDRSSWVTALAASLDQDLPLGIAFDIDENGIPSVVVRERLVLDEEKVLIRGNDELGTFVVGHFNERDNCAELEHRRVNLRADYIRFRASCNGVIDADL